MGELRIATDDPRAADVRQLLEGHLEFSNEHSPPEDVHALDVEELTDPDVSFFSIRDEHGVLLGVGALKALDERHVEIKSMHTSATMRRQGIASTMLDHLVTVARSRGCTRVSLETGSMEAYSPARALYASFGFEPCPPFADYWDSPNSAFMTLELVPRLILLNGAPGVGKSTLARRYADDHPLTLHVEIDALRAALGGWRDHPESRVLARTLALALIEAHLRSGRDAIVAQYLGRPEFITELEATATRAGASFVPFVVTDDEEATAARFRSRRLSGDVDHPAGDVADEDVDATITDAVRRLAARREDDHRMEELNASRGFDGAYETLCRALSRPRPR